MTLRKELAERLLDVACSDNYAAGIASMAPIQWTKTLALNLADECIRQMEWARHEWYSEKLTAAPEGWKP